MVQWEGDLWSSELWSRYFERIARVTFLVRDVWTRRDLAAARGV